MVVVGFQDLWITGSRFYFEPKIVTASQEERLIDFGRIVVANPAVTPEVARLIDSDGGVKSTVHEQTVGIDEGYDIQTSNLNHETMAMLMYGNDAEEFAQSKTVKRVSHYMRPNALAKIHDDDSDRTKLYGLDAVAGVASAAPSSGVLSTDAFTAIAKATKTITTAGDLSSHLSAGDQIIIETTGLADVDNAGTYTVASTTSSTVVVEEAFAADESSITGSLVYAATGDSGTIYDKDTDWGLHHESRGIISALSGGALSSAGNRTVYFTTAALSGKRLIKPHSRTGTIEGVGMVVYGRNNNAQQAVREFDCSITPGGAALNDSDYSQVTLNVRVLNDLTKDDPAGRMLAFKGGVGADFT